ncbi:serine/arginine repetitive matrix protein 2-like [Odocoileus virginianus]|uniref:Serine/arginine repetitive matrix protein 2-like n=1 Tax=Odocoileus virginianus TaxID=9874 RepID=A0ABM4H9J8_ODOVR
MSRRPPGAERDLVDNELGFPENPLALVPWASRHLCPSPRRALCGHLDRPGTSVPSSLLPERREKGLSELPDSGGRWGAQRGWGAPGRGAGLSRAPLSPHPPPLRREFQSERARGLLPGRNHPARRRRVGRRHLTARPRPPRVRGGGSVCSVTNGPSRPARPLARARRGPAREHSSRRLPASRRPARSRPAVPTKPRGRSWHPARRLARGGRPGRLDRGGARLAFPQVSFDMVDGDSSPACEWWFKLAKRLQTCGDRGLQTSQGDILGAPRPESAGGSRTLKAEKVGLPRARAGQPGLGGLRASEVETPRIKHEGHCREPGAGAPTPSAGTSARGAQPSPDGLSPGPGGRQDRRCQSPVDARAPVSGGKGLWEKMEMGLSASFVNRRLSHTRLGNNPPIVTLA